MVAPALAAPAGEAAAQAITSASGAAALDLGVVRSGGGQREDQEARPRVGRWPVERQLGRAVGAEQPQLRREPDGERIQVELHRLTLQAAEREEVEVRRRGDRAPDHAPDLERAGIHRLVIQLPLLLGAGRVRHVVEDIERLLPAHVDAPPPDPRAPVDGHGWKGVSATQVESRGAAPEVAEDVGHVGLPAARPPAIPPGAGAEMVESAGPVSPSFQAATTRDPLAASDTSDCTAPKT